MVSSGENVPFGSPYAEVLTLPYRQLKGNQKPDFGAQIALPNGDDSTKPNSMFFRTSLADTWNAWQEVSVVGHTHSQYLTSHQDISGKAPNNHASSATTYGLATSGTSTSSKYGHVRLTSGDLNGKTYSDGYAASQAHTHSQYQPAGSYANSSHTHAASHITGGTNGYFLKADANGKGVWTSVTIPTNTDSNVASATGTTKSYLLGSTSSGAATGTTTKHTSVFSQNGALYSEGKKVLTGYTEQYKGTVTSVTVTGGTGLSSGGSVNSSGTITLKHAVANSATTLTKNTTDANKYVTGVTLTMDGLGHVTALGISESSDDDTKYTLPNATTATTGGVKLVTGDMNGKTHADGQAPSLNHTHSQYQPAGSYASSSHSHAASHITGGTNGYFLKADSSGKGVWTSVTIPTNTDTATTKDGHYNPGSTATTMGTTNKYLTGLTLDGKGHVTAVGTGTPYSHPTGEGNKHIPSGGSSGQFLGWDSAGTAKWVSNPNTDSATTYDGHYSPSSSTTMGATSGSNYIRGLYMDGKGHVTAVSTGTPADTKVATTTTGATNTTATTGTITFYLAGSPSTSAATSGLLKNPNVYVTKGGSYTTLNAPNINTTAIISDVVHASTTLYANTPSDIIFKGINNATLDDLLANVGGADGNDKVAQALVTSSTNKHYLLGSTASTATTGTTVKNTNAYISGTGTSTVFYAPKLSASTVNATTMTATTAFYQSDERLKDFYGDIEVDFDKLKEIPKKYYTWKSDEKKEMQIGTSAQKVLEVYPELVGGSEEEMYSVDYARLSVIALKAIDKLYDENQLLKDIIGKMDKRIAYLEEKLK